MGINHSMCTSNIFDRFMFQKAKNKDKKLFCKSCLQCLVVLSEHNKVCLRINIKQSVKLEKGTIEFKNLLKKILVQFKIYSDFEFILNSVRSYEGSYSEIY